MDVWNYLTLDVEFEVAYKSKTNTQTKTQLMTKISYEKKNILATSHLSIGQLKNHLLHEGFLYQPSKVQSPSQKFSLNLACFTPLFFFFHICLCIIATCVSAFQVPYLLIVSSRGRSSLYSPPSFKTCFMDSRRSILEEEKEKRRKGLSNTIYFLLNPKLKQK